MTIEWEWKIKIERATRKSQRWHAVQLITFYGLYRTDFWYAFRKRKIYLSFFFNLLIRIFCYMGVKNFGWKNVWNLYGKKRLVMKSSAVQCETKYIHTYWIATRESRAGLYVGWWIINFMCLAPREPDIARKRRDEAAVFQHNHAAVSAAAGKKSTTSSFSTSVCKTWRQPNGKFE